MLRLILLVVIIILVLSFFGISLQGLWAEPTTQANFGFAGQLVVEGWNILVHLFTSSIATIQNFINSIGQAGENVQHAYE